jgi:hypothetical protein
MLFGKQGESSKGSSLPRGQLPWSVIYYLAASGSAPALDFLSLPAIAVITGMRKPWRTAFSERDYEYVRRLGDEHRQNFPRKLAQ